MTKTELIAEAIYQLSTTKGQPFKTEYANGIIYTFHSNGVVAISDGVNLTVQFELNGKFYSVDVR